MTAIVKQRTRNDCALAALAMAVGRPYEELWTPEYQAKIEAAGGCYGTAAVDEAFALAGLTIGVDCGRWHVGGVRAQHLTPMLWRRRAVLSLPSLNTEKQFHMVFWDGHRVLDPSPLQVYRWIDQLAGIEWIYPLADKQCLPEAP